MIIAVCDLEQEIGHGLIILVKRLLNKKGVSVEVLFFETADKLINSNKKIELFFMPIDLEWDGMDALTISDILYKQEKGCSVVFIAKNKESLHTVFGKGVCGLLSKEFKKEQIYNCLKSICNRIISKDDLIELGKNIWVIKSNIKYIKAADKYCKIYTNNKVCLVRITMADIERKLCSRSFIRVHRSYIINLAYVENIDEEILINDGISIRYSRKKKKEILNKYDEYIEEISIGY